MKKFIALILVELLSFASVVSAYVLTYEQWLEQNPHKPTTSQQEAQFKRIYNEYVRQSYLVSIEIEIASVQETIASNTQRCNQIYSSWLNNEDEFEKIMADFEKLVNQSETITTQEDYEMFKQQLRQLDNAGQACNREAEMLLDEHKDLRQQINKLKKRLKILNAEKQKLLQLLQ